MPKGVHRNWDDFLPASVASEQQAWERRARVYLAVMSGAKYHEIARQMKLSITMIGVLYARGSQQNSRLKRGHLTPVERYWTKVRDDLDVLIRRRKVCPMVLQTLQELSR